jgi:hypothetical protein
MLKPTRASSVSILALAAAFGAGLLAAPHLGVAQAQTAAKVYELRTYTAPDGKLADLHKRFRDHTLRIFQKHGMTNVIYLAPMDAPASQNTLVYLLSHQSREGCQGQLDAFRNDPVEEGVSESQVNGPIVSKGGLGVPAEHRLLADEGECQPCQGRSARTMDGAGRAGRGRHADGGEAASQGASASGNQPRFTGTPTAMDW